MNSCHLKSKSNQILIGIFALFATLVVDPASGFQKDLPENQINEFLKKEVDFTSVDQLCNQGLLSDKSIDQIIASFERVAKDSSNPAGQRSKAYLAISFMQWRQGEMSKAIASVKEGIKLKESGDLLVQLAKLSDATGKFDQALAQYQKAIPHLSGSELEKIRVRVTLIQSKGNIQPLIDLAKTKGDEFRNRAAVALAILGHEKAASQLFVVDKESKRSHQFRQKVRLAEWAIRGRDVAQAKEHAWQSVALAKLKRDRRYGLALLVESHRMDNSVQELIQKLKTKKNLTEDESFVLVELFRETKQFEEAISTFKASSGSLTPLLKRQLIGLYRESGRNEDIEKEFQSLISAEPNEVSWPKGLSEHYLERGKREKADQLWKNFIQKNSSSRDLLAAAESLAQLGLDELAIEAAKKSRTNERSYTVGSLFLFELYLSRGRQDAASAILDQLSETLPPKSLSRRDLADGYERLSQPKKALKIWKGLYDQGVELGVDGEMRIAWLQQSVGENEAALTSWYAMLEKTPATQRRLVEDRILTLSAQLGRLGKTAVALEEKILNKTADEKDARMLIKIYTKAGDAGSAVEIIEEFFGDGQSESKNIVLLQEKAQIYRFLGEYKDFAKVTRQLAEVDSKHRLEHIRSLILNHIENSTVNSHDPKKNNAKRNEELKKLIADHNKYADGESAREFEAGVLDLAGEKEKAIEVYRKALAENPNRGDNYLVMANLMKASEETKAAVRMFQFLAERTERDDLFVIAMDGLLNMQDPDSSVLQWAKRITLERLTRKSDKSYLYSLLADLADDSRDVNTQIAALENSLSHANSRRATTLRELIVLTDPNSRMGNRPRKPNVAENLKYSRRLIALRQAFPPEVFVNMGKAFLSAGEPSNAMKAFTMAVDSTGRADLMVEAARQFENRNYLKEALSQYEKSLIANKGDLEVLWRLGQLKERAGWNDAANQLYRDALLGILSRHPIHVDSNRISQKVYVNSALDIPADVRQDPSKTDEYKRHYFVLRDGFIRTLKFDESLKNPSIFPFRDAFIAELKNLKHSPNADLVNYPRLNVLSQFLRYAALSMGDYQFADEVDQLLLSKFPTSKALIETLVQQRSEWGQTGYDTVAASYNGVPEDAISQIRRQWAAKFAAVPSQFVTVKSGKSRSLWGNQSSGGKTADLEHRLSVAILTGNQKTILDTCKELVKSSMYERAVLQGKNSLDPNHFKLLCRYVVSRVRGNQNRLQAVLGESNNHFGIYRPEMKRDSWLDIVDQTVGEPMVPFDGIVQYVENAKYIYRLDFKYILKHLKGEKRIRFLKALGNPSKMKHSASMKFLVVKSMLQEVLTQPITEREQKIWLELIKSNGKKNDRIRRAQNDQFFNNIRFCNENTQFVRKIAQSLDPSGKSLKPGTVITCRLAIADNDTTGALNQWLDCYMEGRFLPRFNGVSNRQSLFGYYSDQFIENTYDEILKNNRSQLVKLIEEREKSAGSKKKLLVDLQMKLLPFFQGTDPKFSKDLLNRLAQKYPENQLVSRQLLQIYQQEEDTISEIHLLEKLTEKFPRDKSNRQKLYRGWLRAGNPVKALALKPKSPPKKKVQRPVPGKKPIVRTKIRTINRSRMSPQSELRSAVVSGDKKKIQSIVRKMWQAVVVSLGKIEYSMVQDGSMRMELDQFVKMPWPKVPQKNPTNKNSSPKPTETQSVCDGLVQYPFSVAEFKSWIRALRADEIDTAYPIFQALAKAIINHGDPAGTRDQLAEAIFQNRQGDKGVTLWLALLEADSKLADPSQIQRVQRLLGKNIPLRRSQILAIANIFTRAGDMNGALKMYRSALCSVISRDLKYQNIRNRPTVLSLVQNAKKSLPKETYRIFLSDVFHLTKPPFGQGLEDSYMAFAMKLLPEDIDKSEFKATYGQWVISQMTDQIPWTPEQAIKAAKLLKESDAYDQAVAVLKKSLLPVPKGRRNNGLSYGTGYKQMLGVDRWNQTRFFVRGQRVSPSLAKSFVELFPSEKNSEEGRWLLTVANALGDSWIVDPALDSSKVLDLSKLVFEKLVAVNNQAGAQKILNSVSKRFQIPGAFTAKSANLWVKMSNDAGIPMDLSVCQNLAQNDVLLPKTLVSVLKRTSKEQGAEAVLKVGKKATNYCLDNQFLELMAQAAKQANDEQMLADLLQLKNQAQEARDALKGE